MSGKVLINSVYSKIRIRFVQVMFQNIPHPCSFKCTSYSIFSYQVFPVPTDNKAFHQCNIHDMQATLLQYLGRYNLFSIPFASRSRHPGTEQKMQIVVSEHRTSRFFFSLILLLFLGVTKLDPFKDGLNIAPNID